MALVYSAIASLDGYIADEDGTFDWAEPDTEVHAFANEAMRRFGTHLYGRLLYEVMVWWETSTDPEPVLREFAEVWRAADKIVYSRTLEAVSSARTRIERSFDPAAVGRLVAGATADVLVGGADLAGQAFAAGLVDEVQLFVVPAVVGGGTRALTDGVRLDLTLLESRIFGNGTAFLRYRTAGARQD